MPPPMNIYEHFSCYTKLPIKLSDVRDHILEVGHVEKIHCVPVASDSQIFYGAFQRYRDIASYSNGDVALIGYRADLPEEWQRVVVVKEMLHALDPAEATSPTKERVLSLIDDLMVGTAKKAMGLGIPAQYDMSALLHAVCILVPRSWLDIIRPYYKRGVCTAAEVANWAKVPEVIAQVVLTDAWRDAVEAIG